MSVIEMKVPTIGESVTEVTLSQWLKPNGSIVELDEPICEFESDKATLEFPAEASGKLEWVAAEGDDLEIGALVARIDTSASAEKKKDNDEKPADKKEAPKEEQKEKDSKGAADKKESADKEDKSDKGQQTEADNDEVESSYAAGHPSPAAAKILREKGISPDQVKGTGKDGRITKEDAEAATPKSETVKDGKQKDSEQKDTQSKSEKKAAFSRNERTQKMSRMRRTIAKRLVSAKNTTAMLTTFNELDMSAIMELRKSYQDEFVEKYGIKLGFMSLFAKACAQALMEMPDVNARIDDEELIYHDFVDISIAISTPNGLVVPPVKNVESLHFADIEKRIKELSEKARDGKLSLEEMTGGTFTITNGGIFGSMMSTPILNEPQSAILGMHNIIQRPVVINGQIEIRPMMYLALSYDHRVIDGSTSVTFLVKVKELLEDPVRMLLDV
jgi:2-oxoglutarate dehydrogenase E2 component (dihydrolipoamide succinyltransferase)